jgi:hypothetical protein
MDTPGPWIVECILRVTQPFHWCWIKSCLIICRMPTNLFIKASWKQNWEKQLVVSQKMYLHEVYFKGSSISRYNVICDVWWVWHLKMSQVVRFISSLFLVELSPPLPADLILISILEKISPLLTSPKSSPYCSLPYLRSSQKKVELWVTRGREPTFTHSHRDRDRETNHRAW